MEKLPREVHLKIFSTLSYKDKFACLFVSKSWSKCVQSYLVENTNVNELERVILYFEKYPNLQKHVRRLKISDCPGVFTYMPEFPTMFPNVLEFTVEDFGLPFQFNYDPRKEVTPGTWKSLQKLDITETIDDEIPLVLERLLYNSCPNVTELLITRASSCFNFPNKVVRQFFMRLYKLLPNIPGLTNLVLKYIVSNITDLETLHKNAPNLKSLSLRNTKLSIVDAITPPPEPVKLNSLKIQLVEDEFIEQPFVSALFEYIANKYKGLTSISLTSKIHYSFPRFNDYEALGNTLLPLFENNPQLTTYDQMFCPLTSGILEKMDECGIQLRELVLYFQEDTLDEQHEYLLESNQMKNITHLTTVRIDESGWSDVDPIALASQMTNLEHWTVRSPLNRFNLKEFNTYLSSVPKLTSITFCDSRVEIDEDELFDERPRAMDLPEATNIKRVEFVNLTISDDEMVSSWIILKKVLARCPNLEHFAINLNLQTNWQPMYFDSALDKKIYEYTKPPYALRLDFSYNKHLKSIDIALKYDDSYFEIVRKKPDTREYYRHSFKNNSLDKIEKIPTNKYYTSIELAHPVLLNSFRI